MMSSVDTPAAAALVMNPARSECPIARRGHGVLDHARDGLVRQADRAHLAVTVPGAE
jgi:hypothetical protein